MQFYPAERGYLVCRRLPAPYLSHSIGSLEVEGVGSRP